MSHGYPELHKGSIKAKALHTEEALRALGEARAAAGEEEGASEAFEEAAAVARETGSVFELGQVEAARESARIAAS